MGKGLDLAALVAGLWPDLDCIETNVEWDSDDNPVIRVTLYFPDERTDRIRADLCRTCADRVRDQYYAWASKQPPQLFITPALAGVVLEFRCPQVNTILHSNN
jgi:hypothetical protein